MTKKQVRTQMKKQRANLSQKVVLESSIAIWDKVYNGQEYKNSRIIFLYYNIRNEINTSLFANQVQKDGKKVAYPVTNMETMTLDFHLVDNPSQLSMVRKGNLKLIEPKPDPSTKVIPDASNLMIVPGLAFDRNLYRTGYGGGFYDKYLDQYPELKTIGVCYDFQVVDKLPINQYDKAVEILITPESIYR